MCPLIIRPAPKTKSQFGDLLGDPVEVMRGEPPGIPIYRQHRADIKTWPSTQRRILQDGLADPLVSPKRRWPGYSGDRDVSVRLFQSIDTSRF
jgi:hypothetical protein